MYLRSEVVYDLVLVVKFVLEPGLLPPQPLLHLTNLLLLRNHNQFGILELRI